MDDLLKLMDLVVKIILILGGIAAIERGKEALDQWLIEKRGGDVYEIGKKFGLKTLNLAEAIHRIRQWGGMDSESMSILDILRKQQGMDVYDPLYVTVQAKAARARNMLAELRVLNLEAKVFGVDFNDELEGFSNIVLELEVESANFISSEPEMAPKAKESFYGKRNDTFGVKVETLSQQVLDKVRNQMLGHAPLVRKNLTD